MVRNEPQVGRLSVICPEGHKRTTHKRTVGHISRNRSVRLVCNGSKTTRKAKTGYMISTLPTLQTRLVVQDEDKLGRTIRLTGWYDLAHYLEEYVSSSN